MRLLLNTPLRKALAVAIALLLTVPYLNWVQRHYRAERWAESMNIAGIEQASQLEPDNTDTLHKVGRFYLYAEQDSTKAVPPLQRAVLLNRYAARYWLDLAAAHRFAGDEQGQRQAVFAAVWADPKTPIVAWEAANLLLTSGKTDEALPFFRTVIENDPDSAQRAFYLCWRATENTDLLLDKITPPTANAHLAFIEILMGLDRISEAMKVWTSLSRSGQPVGPRSALVFVNYLIVHHQPDAAAQVWKDVARFNPWLSEAPRDGEISIVNGSFEEDILDGGFAWRTEPPPSVSLVLDDNEFHSGTRSLSLTFNGQPFQYAGLSQYVPVEPNSHYEFSVFVKTQEVQTAAGPRFWVQDAYDQSVIFATGREWLGSHSWQEDRIAFTTGPDTHLIALRIVRQPADKLISGRMWVDDVRLFRR